MPLTSPSLLTPFLTSATDDGGGGEPRPPRGIWDGDSGDLYTRAVRSGAALWYTVDAYRDDVLIVGDLRPTGGSVTDTTKPGSRRLLSLELAPESGLFDLLAPTGVELRVVGHVQLADRNVVDIPMGWFVVGTVQRSEGGGSLRLSAPDRWEKIRRARFVRPRSAVKGRRVIDEITSLIRGALGSTTEVLDLSGSQAKISALTYERDRDQAILKLAADAGLWVFFDRDGVATIDRQPTGNTAPAWRADASATGVLISLDRERSRTATYNVVVIESSAPDAPAFPTQRVFDANPASSTYAGPDPLNRPDLAGPFGVVPYFHDTPLPLSVTEARATALTILARTIGLASQASFEMGPNPKVSAGTVLEVLPEPERGASRLLERHLAETLTHSLTLGGSLRIEGRSSRSDQYASEA